MLTKRIYRFSFSLALDGLSLSLSLSLSFSSIEIPKVKLSNNGLLSVNCEKEAQRLFATWKEKYTSEITETQKPIYIDKELTTWQNIQLYTGKITLGLLGLTILAFLIRFLITKKLL